MIDTQLAGFKSEIIGAIAQFKQAHGKRLDDVEALIGRPDSGQGTWQQPGSGQSLADQIWGDSNFESWRRTAKGIFAFQTKTAITSTTIGSSTPGILTPQRVGGIIKPGVRRLRVADLLPIFPTSSSAVEYVKENAFTNAASPQVEANSKGESALTFTIASAPVRTIAHWLPASKQILDDFQALGLYLNSRLIDGLKDKEDTELLTGDGLGVHLTGLVTSATAYDTARIVASDTRIDKLSHAISQLEDSNFDGDGIVMHPADWRTISLIKTEEGGANKGTYIIGSPSSDAIPMLWGKPVATTTAMTSGKFLVGSFRTACAVWQRQEAVVEISDSHADYWIANMLAVRCEERLALAVYKPTALIYGAF